MFRNARLMLYFVIGCLMLAFCVTPAAANGQSNLAVWLWGSTVRTQGAEAVVKGLAENHVTDVFLLVRGTAGKADYASAIAPPAEADKDALGDMMAVCRPLGIRVHAWFVFNQDKAYIDLHPEDSMWHHGKANTEFKPYRMEDGKVCPMSEAHLGYMNDMIREVLENYDVVGIHLDYIRYGHMVYCFCPDHVQKATNLGISVDRVREVIFETSYASNANPNRFFEAYESGDADVVAWVKMRQSEIRGAAASMRAVAREAKPNVIFSASLMPEGALVDTNSFAMCHYGQSYEDAGELYDLVCPMAYHLDFGKSPAWVGDVARGTIELVGSDVPVYIGVQAYGNKADRDAVQEAIAAGLEAGAEGVALFRFGTMNEERWSAVSDALK